MGADFDFSINELQVTEHQAKKNVQTLVDEKNFEETLHILETQFNLFTHLKYDVIPEDVRIFLMNCVETVYEEGRRDAGRYRMADGRVLAITGGMSWGDNPTDSYQAFSICETLGVTLKNLGKKPNKKPKKKVSRK
jgi:hypothetical protein